jgi:hypothetical protein
MALTREQVVALAKYEMELYEEEREIPAEDALRIDVNPYMQED